MCEGKNKEIKKLKRCWRDAARIYSHVKAHIHAIKAVNKILAGNFVRISSCLLYCISFAVLFHFLFLSSFFFFGVPARRFSSIRLSSDSSVSVQSFQALWLRHAFMCLSAIHQLSENKGKILSVKEKKSGSANSFYVITYCMVAGSKALLPLHKKQVM